MPKDHSPTDEGEHPRRFAKPSALRRGAACIACRQKKIRCDGQRPVCGRCLRTYNTALAHPQGESLATMPECIYEDSPQSTNAHASSSTHPATTHAHAHAHAHQQQQQPAADGSATALEARVQQLESMLRMAVEGGQASGQAGPASQQGHPINANIPAFVSPLLPPPPPPPSEAYRPPPNPAPMSVPQTTYQGENPYAYPWGQPHVSFPHPIFDVGRPPAASQAVEEAAAPPTWPFPLPPPPASVSAHRQASGESPSSFHSQGTPRVSTSSEGTVPTPSSNEGFFPSPQPGGHAHGDKSFTGSPEEDAALKGVQNVPEIADPVEAAVEVGADDEAWLLQLLWPNWPPHLPVPGQLQHIVEAFFTHVPFATDLLNKPRFLSRLGLPPSHRDFPHPAVLHAICAATSRFVGSLDLLPIAGYAVNPMSCDYPRLANKNETPMDRRPIWNGDGPRPPIDVVRNGHIYTPGIDGDFGQVHSSWARIYAEESVNLPEHWIEASQALLILSQYFTQHGLWTNAFGITSQIARMTSLMALNGRGFPAGDRRTYKKGPLVPAAKDDVEEAERRNLFWMLLYVDSTTCSQSGWEGLVSTEDLWLALPTSSATFSPFNPPPPPTQYADSPNIFSEHPSSHNSPFAVTMKAALLLRRAADYVRRADLKGVEHPRETQQFHDLDADLTAFINTAPAALAQSPGGFASMNGLAIDPDIVIAQCIPLATVIILHDRYCDLSDPLDPSLPKLRDATRGILDQIHALNRTSFDFGLIHPYIVVAWQSTARTLLRMLQQALDDQKMANVPALLSSVEVIRLAMCRVGERLPIGQRIGSMTNEMLVAVLRPSGDRNVIIPYK